MQSTEEINFTHMQDIGLLTLSGVVDIFEAERLYDTARQVAENEAVQTLHLDMAAVERLDISIVQILMALKASTIANNKAFGVQSISESAQRALTMLGVSF